MKIALLGSAPSSAHLAPYRDASFQKFAQGPVASYPPSAHIDEQWDIWGCSPGAYGVAVRATAWFELHRYEPGKEWFSPQYCQFLQEFKGPVYTGRKLEELPNSVVYPLDEIENKFSSYFLSSSLALMCALAIVKIEEARQQPDHDDADDIIGFWGVDMSATEEWNEQRPGCQHFILEALERGIGVYVPYESDLLRPMPVYGITEHDHNYIKLTARMRELVARRQAAHETMVKAQAEMAHLVGAIDNMNYMIKTWLSPYDLSSGVVLRRKPTLLPPTELPDSGVTRSSD